MNQSYVVLRFGFVTESLWCRGLGKMWLFTRQGGFNKKMQLRCIVGNVGSSIFGPTVCRVYFDHLFLFNVSCGYPNVMEVHETSL